MPSYEGGDSQPVAKIAIPSHPLQHGKLDDAMKQHQTDIANALRPYHQAQTPLLLQNLHKSDSIYFWKSLEYWRVAVGEDTPVEVEIGKRYNSGSRVPMSFGEYLDYMVMNMQHENEDYRLYLQKKEGYDRETEKEEMAYLAQHELFPEVLNDITIPHLCDDSNGEYDVGEGKLYHTMLWMGPRHTVSPLHFDPLDNILIQVVGWKRVLLFPPDDKKEGTNSVEGDSADEPTWHYAGTKGNQYNTSPVDIEDPDHVQYPNFKALSPTAYECLLGPGDGLYIPKRWWHHVRSLELSISANVWYR